MPVATTGMGRRVRTSLDIPQGLQRRIRKAVQRGVVRSQNALIVQAVEAYLAQLERDEIDAQFAAMEHDESYQALHRQIETEFARSEWEAWQAVGSER